MGNTRLILDRGDAVGWGDRVVGRVTLASGQLLVLDGGAEGPAVLCWPTEPGVYDVCVQYNADGCVANICIALTGLVTDTS